jgi:phosphoribosylformylglycinamidine synthase II
MSTAFRLEITNTVQENRIASFTHKIQAEGLSHVSVTGVSDVYSVAKKFSDAEKNQIGKLFVNPVCEIFSLGNTALPHKTDYILEIGYLPGVTDNLASTVTETIEDGLKTKFAVEEGTYSSLMMFLVGVQNETQAKKIGAMFANELIQRISYKTTADYINQNGMDIIIPQVKLSHAATSIEIDINNMSDTELEELGKKGIKNTDGTFRGPLALSLTYLQAIKKYFASENRNPKDIELEAIAQTWSEHCRHTIFANPIDEVEKGIFSHYIRRATVDIRKNKSEKDFCVSVFSDNAGGIVFDENWVVCDKMETHNSPSALDPLGGAMTGIVGVNRDILGYGKGARPVINRYGFCTGDPDQSIELYRGKDQMNPALQPKKILEGVVEGVEQGGNQSGIPTPQGFVYCDERYSGKPLVFAGCVGLIPREIDGENSSLKGAQPGDAIIMAGGRIGVDGIHGATFSSEALDSSSPATAVQIGDPITQKKMIDAIVYELRDEGFINSVHDCGAGGISGTIGELGMEAGGFEVQLENAPLKYPNMSPWEIWISESQERMCFSVPVERAEEFCKKFAKRGVEATIMGNFTETGRGKIFFHGDLVYDLNLEFLEKGWPKELQTTIRPAEREIRETISDVKSFSTTDLNKTLETLLKRKNICSYEYISAQYDHIVQGGAVVGPLQGAGKVNGTAAVTRPVLDSNKAVVTSQALNPKSTETDAYNMAVNTIDDAVAAAVAVGANVDHMAIMDNFCWCSSDEGERLHQLKEAAKGCYDAAVTYGTPYISGKDSMYNDFRGYDKDNNPVKISIPPTLLVSALSVIDDATKVQTMDFKFAGDHIYVIGDLTANIGGSEFLFTYAAAEALEVKAENFSLPTVNTITAVERYRQLYQANQDDLFVSIQHIGRGGLGIALAKSCIAGQIGASVMRPLSTTDLFAESKSCFLVSIAPDKVQAFEKMFSQATQIGVVSDSGELSVNNEKISLQDMSTWYKSPFGGY